MIRSAPASLAACTIHSPRCPHPTTATASPGWTCPTLKTAPTPVVMPHPSSVSVSSGSVLSSGNAHVPRIVMSSA